MLRGRTLYWLTLAATLSLSCGRGRSEWPVAQDLIAGFPLAEAWSETRVVDFGTARADRLLAAGWDGQQWDRGRREGFVVGRGDESEVDFLVLRPRPLDLRLHVRPTREADDEILPVEVLVNGNRVGDLEVRERVRRFRLPVPEGFLRVGENRLTLRYLGGESQDTGVGAGGDRGSKVAWYRLVVQDPQRVEAPEPVVLRDGRSLLIPFGSRLEYYVQLPPEGAFTAEGVEWLGEGGGRLELVLEEDGKSPTHLVTLEEPTQGLEVSIRGAAPRIARLSLRAERPFVRSDARSGVILVQPALRVPPGRPEPSDRRSEAETSGAPVEQRPNILLYVVDTLRADHLGVYGYSKPVSPHIDRFAADATVFDNALAQSSWTRASMASIFTGLWPVKHAANGRKDILDPAAETLAEILHAAGYVTVARVRNWNVFPVFGFRQGFEDFVAVDRGKADRMNALVRQWLDRRPRERPFFLYVHTVDPHGPYRPPGEFRTRFFEPDQEPLELDRHPGFRVTEAMTEEERLAVARHLLALYDGEIAFNDREFGRLLSMLEDEQLLDHTMIVFVSDHGEEFLEHGTWEHGRNLFAENLNVPLIIRIADRGRGRHIGEVVQHIDLMATILDHAGLPIPEQVEGRSLLALLDQADEEAAGQARPAFSFLHLDGLPHRSLVAGDWKLIERLSPEGTVLWDGLFHRGEDPLEARNRARDYPILTRYMGLLLEAKVAEGSLLTTEEAVLDARTERALRALGYLQ